LNTIVHIPHASVLIPEEVREQFVLSDEALRLELLRMTDWYTDEIFGQLPGCVDVAFPVSRLVVDPERFENDQDEAMSEIGMGVIYQNTSELTSLRRALGQIERKRLIEDFYHPHHAKLNQLAKCKLENNGHCLVLDAHSFPARPLFYEIDKKQRRPEICIGTDEFHTPQNLIGLAVGLFESAGFEVGLNSPFAGAMVPSDFYNKDKRLWALMIEVRRDLYMDEQSGEKLPGFDEVRNIIRRQLVELVKCGYA
jgi:N-formylglutamate amidohydrolase